MNRRETFTTVVELLGAGLIVAGVALLAGAAVSLVVAGSILIFGGWLVGKE